MLLITRAWSETLATRDTRDIQDKIMSSQRPSDLAM